jgi:prolipoprotein diacylglyceryl transferase
VPSPSSAGFSIGPLSGHWYGLCVALGALAYAAVAALAWRRRGGDWVEMFWACMVTLPAAVVGARLSHLATGGAPAPGEHALAFWRGGLGIYGGVAGGLVALLGYARLRRLDAWLLFDCAVPGLALGQAIGRLGNWFNQELYGRPTDLPWGLSIDPAHRLAGYARFGHFQPVFAYEALWSLALALLLWRLVTRRPPVTRGIAFGTWMVGYGLGRLWIEGLRIEPATRLGPLRLNQVVSLVVVAAGAALVAVRARRRA